MTKRSLFDVLSQIAEDGISSGGCGAAGAVEPGITTVSMGPPSNMVGTMGRINKTLSSVQIRVIPETPLNGSRRRRRQRFKSKVKSILAQNENVYAAYEEDEDFGVAEAEEMPMPPVQPLTLAEIRARAAANKRS